MYNQGKLERWIIVMMGVVGLVAQIIVKLRDWLYDQLAHSGWQLVLFTFIDFISGLCISILIFYINIQIIKKLRNKYPWEGNVKKRIALELIYTTLNVNIVVIAITFFTHYYISPKVHLGRHLYGNITIGNAINLIMLCVYEGVYLFQEWKKHIIQNERAEREKIISQYEILKSQVNPHFLFNTLNTLSALILIDPVQGEKYVNQLSKVFRYLLDNNEDLVPLSDEINFVLAYCELYKIRFNDAIHLTIQIDQEVLESKYIPPLGIQMLIENAIKHNAITSTSPLCIDIKTEDDYIVVQNNILVKQDGDKYISTGIGLKNLSARFELLIGKKPEIVVNENTYVVRVPIA